MISVESLSLYWMVSENHGNAPSFVRKPLPYCHHHPSHRSQLMAEVFDMNSGDRTRYPNVAFATNGPAGLEEGPALKGRNDNTLMHTSTANAPCLLLQCLAWKFLNESDIGLIFKSIISACRLHSQTIYTLTRLPQQLSYSIREIREPSVVL